ncbi:hypothetical protein SAVIM40S_02269 [Streptomyces avidinii]
MFGAEDALPVVEVVGGVDDGDGGGVGEGAQGFGDVGGGADAEGEVAGVGAAEGFGFAGGVELGEVDFEEVALGFQRTASTWWPKWRPGTRPATQRQ